MSKRAAPSTFGIDYYSGKLQDHAQYLSIVERQAELFLDIGQATVKLFRRRYFEHSEMKKEEVGHLSTKSPSWNHSWFGRFEAAEESGLPQMDELLDALFAEHPELYEDMVDLQYEMSAPKDKANWMSGRMKDPLELTTTDYWMKADMATNTQLPTLNNLKRLSIYLDGRGSQVQAYFASLKSHGIKVTPAKWPRGSPSTPGLAFQPIHCSFLPGQNYNSCLPPDFKKMQEAFPCLTSSIHIDALGTLSEGALSAACAFLGYIPGMYPQGATSESAVWGVFYHGNSGLFVAPIDRQPMFHPTPYSKSVVSGVHIGADGALDFPDPSLFDNDWVKDDRIFHTHVIADMELACATEGWNNLLAPTLDMRLRLADEETAMSSNSMPLSKENTGTDAKYAKEAYWDGLTRSLGATIFFRMASDKTMLSPSYYSTGRGSKARRFLDDEWPTASSRVAGHPVHGGGSGAEYIHPVMTHTGSMWKPGDEPSATSGEVDKTSARFINSWADKRPTLNLKQGDGRYYHNIVRCSACNGRVKVTLGRTPKPISPLHCPHCERPGIEIDTIHWTVKA